MYSILLAGHRLGLLALLDVEYVHGLIVGCGDQKLALIVEIEGCNVRLDIFAFDKVGELLCLLMR